MPESEGMQVTFENGLNTVDRASLLDDGELQALTNWEWTPIGGLTPRPAWQAAGNSPTGSPTSKRGRGIFTGWYQSGARVLVVSTYDNAGNYVTFRTNVGDPTTFTSYTQIDSTAVSASYQSLPMAFSVGDGVLLLTNPGFTSGQVRAYNGTATSAVTTNDVAGRCVVFHLNRFWSGGSVANPTYVRFTEIGDHTNWNVTENFIPVSQEDGEPVEDIVVWDRGLVIGKRHSLWFLSGSTVDTFALHPISRRVGCAVGRSLVATEEGVFIIASDGNVYLWDGGRVNRLTSKFQTSVRDAPASGAYIGGKFYVKGNDAATTAWCWEPTGKGGRWRTESYTDSTNAPLDIASLDETYLLATTNNGARVMSVRQEAGPFAASGYRAADTDAGVGETFTATTKQWWPRGPLAKTTVRSIYVRYHQWQAGSAECFIIPIVDGTDVTAQQKSFGGKAAAGTYAERLDFNAAESAVLSGRNFSLRFSQVANDNDAVYTIDEVWVQTIADKGRR